MSNPADPRFRDVEAQYAALKSQLTSGQLTREQFETALQKLMILDAQGRYWMMGAESGRWYVHDGQNWVQQNPPGATPPAAVPPPPPTPDEHRANRADAATLSSFIPPQVPKAAPQPLPSDQAQTLVGFTPPQAPSQPAKPVSRPDAPTMVGFTPPTVPPQTPPTAPPQTGSGGGRGISPVLLMVGLFLIVCVLGVAALLWAVYTRFAPDQAPAATVAAAATSAPAIATATTAPTTVPAVATPTASRPTATAAAVIPTISIVRPTATTAPATATSAPTNTPAPPAPTDTPTNPPPPPPTRTPTPMFNLTFSFQGYADWGRPDINNPATYCTNFNNGFKWRQFVWDTFVTNRSTTTLTPSEWTSTAYTDQGSETRVCPSNLPNMPAGQTIKATFVAYVEAGRYVQRVVHQIRGASFQRCLDSAWKEIGC